MNKTKTIAFSGILTALSVVLIFLGTVISVFAYIAPILSGLVIISALRNVNEKSAWLIYVAVSLITFLFMPDKECSLTYIFFFGFYPIVKPRIEKISNKFYQMIMKIVLFNFGIIISQLICFYIFKIPFDNIFGKWGIAVLLLLANLLFFVYDKFIFIIDILYMKKLYVKISNIIK